MRRQRLPLRDPRTVARDIPGVLDILFPRLSGALVGSLNKRISQFSEINAIPDHLVEMASLQHSLLFEVAVARAEALLAENDDPDWTDCLIAAVERQKRHFDAKIPGKITKQDKKVADWAASNLVNLIHRIEQIYGSYGIQTRPIIPGFGWIASGVGDFALDVLLIEIKNTDRNFIAADYRQILIYWLLKYSYTLQFGGDAWPEYALVNPRKNLALFGSFDELVMEASGGLSRVEAYEYFRSIVVGDFENQQ